MALITVPNPRAIGVAPDGMYMWRYHTRDVERAVVVCRYAVAHRCPPVSAPMTWFETEEAALMAHAMKPALPPGTWIPVEAIEDGLIDLPIGATHDIFSGGWRTPK